MIERYVSYLLQILKRPMREVLYNVLIEFGIPLKLVWLIKMCLNETHSKDLIDKNLMPFLFTMI